MAGGAGDTRLIRWQKMPTTNWSFVWTTGEVNNRIIQITLHSSLCAYSYLFGLSTALPHDTFRVQLSQVELLCRTNIVWLEPSAARPPLCQHRGLTKMNQGTGFLQQCWPWTEYGLSSSLANVFLVEYVQLDGLTHMARTPICASYYTTTCVAEPICGIHSWAQSQPIGAALPNKQQTEYHLPTAQPGRRAASGTTVAVTDVA